MMLILRWFSHKTADFATFTLKVYRLIRYEEKWEKIKKESYSWFQEIKENTHINLSYKTIEIDFKN